jgi:hypothetical protein
MTTGDSNFSVDCQQYPAHMRDSISHIIQEQCNFGWQNALHGLLSKSWIDLASLSYNIDHRSSRDGERQMSNTLKSLFTFSQGLWAARNAALHNSDDNANQKLRFDMADSITYLHQQNDQICFDDRYLCNMPLEKLLRSSPQHNVAGLSV